jgi:hypothetical protein
MCLYSPEGEYRHFNVKNTNFIKYYKVKTVFAGCVLYQQVVQHVIMLLGMYCTSKSHSMFCCRVFTIRAERRACCYVAGYVLYQQVVQHVVMLQGMFCTSNSYSMLLCCRVCTVPASCSSMLLCCRVCTVPASRSSKLLCCRCSSELHFSL